MLSHMVAFLTLFQRILLAVEENQPIKKWLKKLSSTMESKTKATM